jgi:hypothetical protein
VHSRINIHGHADPSLVKVVAEIIHQRDKELGVFVGCGFVLTIFEMIRVHVAFF